MRKQKEQAIEKYELQEEAFLEIKDRVKEIFQDPILRRDFKIALIFPHLKSGQQRALFEGMVQKNAEFCLSGDTAIYFSAEQECHFFTKMLNHLAHARPALERAVALYHETGKPMPQRLREWADNPGNPPPKKRGPRKFAQDWKAMRDYIIALQISWAVEMQREDPRWPVTLPIRRHDSSNSRKKDLSICRAVLEVLKDLCDDLPDCHPPTYRMVWNAWRRYQNEIHPNGKPRPGRSILPPQGIETVLNPPGVDTERRNQTLRKITEDHMLRCA